MSRNPITNRRPNQSKEKNGYWKGGRVIASNGYVLIKVGYDHHLADIRGYAYEHRIVAEQKISRRLVDGEMVHHIDENKQNNSPDNLVVVSSNAEHFVHHRKPGGKKLRMPGEENSLVDCACGCGTAIQKYDSVGRPRDFVSGHNGPNFIRGMVLCYLENVPERGTTQFISEMFGLNEGSVRNVLTSLKKEGFVTRDSRIKGEWRLANA